jgi:hypothetical protein
VFSGTDETLGYQRIWNKSVGEYTEGDHAHRLLLIIFFTPSVPVFNCHTSYFRAHYYNLQILTIGQNVTFQNPETVLNYLICMGSLEGATSYRDRRLLVCYVVACKIVLLYVSTL